MLSSWTELYKLPPVRPSIILLTISLASVCSNPAWLSLSIKDCLALSKSLLVDSCPKESSKSAILS